MKPITTSLFCHLLLVQLSLSILSTYASQTCIWSGLGDGVSWHDAANWSPAPPATGDSVTIDAGTLLLSASTPQLNAFTMSGGTLTFTNWTTTLQASIITLSGNALFTLPAPFSDTDMSNRVSIVCDSLHIDSTSKIDVSGQGFLALSGPAIPGGYGGGSHGGGAKAYGCPFAADTPGGSGGGSGGNPQWGGAGGGVVIIETGHLQLEGKIVADGGNGTGSKSGGGAGGGIRLITTTLAGDGSVAARGGGGKGTEGYDGHGGRISVSYDTAQQKLLSTPSAITFSTRGGTNKNHPGQIGTLAFTDALLFPQEFS